MDPENVVAPKPNLSHLFRWSALACLSGWLAGPAAASAADTGRAAAAPGEVSLYALDCGRFEFKGSMGMFSDTGEYDEPLAATGGGSDAVQLVREPFAHR